MAEAKQVWRVFVDHELSFETDDTEEGRKLLSEIVESITSNELICEVKIVRCFKD